MRFRRSLELCLLFLPDVIIDTVARWQKCPVRRRKEIPHQQTLKLCCLWEANCRNAAAWSWWLSINDWYWLSGVYVAVESQDNIDYDDDSMESRCFSLPTLPLQRVHQFILWITCRPTCQLPSGPSAVRNIAETEVWLLSFADIKCQVSLL